MACEGSSGSPERPAGQRLHHEGNGESARGCSGAQAEAKGEREGELDELGPNDVAARASKKGCEGGREGELRMMWLRAHARETGSGVGRFNMGWDDCGSGRGAGQYGMGRLWVRTWGGSIWDGMTVGPLG